MKKLVILLVIVNTVAWSAPNSSFKYLMDEPMSMLDWGIYKMKKYYGNGTATGTKESDKPFRSYTDVTYDWDKDRLLVTEKHFFEKKLSKKRAKQLCKDTIASHREFDSHISSYFLHQGFHSANQPESLDKDILRNLYYYIDIRTRDKEASFFKSSISCEGSFKNSKVMYSE